jgi:hypothetical protein
MITTVMIMIMITTIIIVKAKGRIYLFASRSQKTSVARGSGHNGQRTQSYIPIHSSTLQFMVEVVHFPRVAADGQPLAVVVVTTKKLGGHSSP